MIRELLAHVVRGGRLNRDEAAAAVRAMVRGEAEPAVVAAFLTALAARGETGEELLGGAIALRGEAVPFTSKRPAVLDTCGTGGDAAHQINVSTAAALVAASAGIPVAKHGNRSVSSRCGSADVLEALGARVDLGPQGSARVLEETGFTFLYARRFHPAMRQVAPIRQALGIRTLFNWLGPLCNPAGVTRQLLGVSDGSRVGMVAEVLAGLGLERALVVHGAGGVDELSLEPGNTVLEVHAGAWPRPREVEAAAIGLSAAPPEALQGGDPAENAGLLRAVLAGERGPRRDAVLLNAAAAIWVAGGASTLAAAAELAAERIDSGAAARLVEAYVALSQRAGDE